MNRHARTLTRRGFLGGAALAGAAWTTPGLFAQALAETAGMTEGPYYPDRMPLDTDNDLLILNDATTPAVGEVTRLTGSIRTLAGEPLSNAFVEIWQVDNRGSYIHTNGASEDGRDANFQGYGRFLTGSTGEYYFRTIKPRSYDLGGAFRAPHIHFAVSRGGNRVITTQAHVRGHEQNSGDRLLSQLGRQADVDIDTVLVDFVPIPDSPIGELSARFDIVIGRTLEEVDGDPLGRLARPQGGGFGGRGRFRRGR